MCEGGGYMCINQRWPGVCESEAAKVRWLHIHERCNGACVKGPLAAKSHRYLWVDENPGTCGFHLWITDTQTVKPARIRTGVSEGGYPLNGYPYPRITPVEFLNACLVY